ncbi:MAG: sodium:solute symporter family protein [Proteobacteria bacterium]|nr:sodium:solute symporter family protein [Pseudomonadota bacterium]NOG61674.1 sodium:solute symporter family protein [Pseudomonadota bacterium]
MNSFQTFDLKAWLFISIYLGSLIIVGFVGFKARKENTLKDFYLAGNGFGLVVIFLTLYATQYSGNTLFGYSGKTYRVGYAWIMSIHFMTAIVACYMIYAPRLYARAKKYNYITPTDYLQHRFNSNWLNIIATLIMIVVLGNYLLAQLMAMGRAMQGLTSIDPVLAYQQGVILLTLIMVIYGTLGGIRAVAWTDVIQGLVLIVGFIILLLMLIKQFGPISLATDTIQQMSGSTKANVPEANRLREWLSYIIIVGLGSTLYPQAIQRIYAARSEKVLRQGLAFMSFAPLFTVLIAVITGIYAIAYIPGLEGTESDQVLTRMLAIVQGESVMGYWLVVILFSAILAAMMSTADSALLSISSMLSKDIYGRFIQPNATEARLTLMGKLFSWVLILFLVWLAIYLSDKASLLKLLDRKFDLLIQLVPAFMISIHWRGLKTTPTLVGLISGVLLSLWLAYGGFNFVQNGKLYGFHPGLAGLLLNFVIAVSGSLYLNKK